jgi:CRP/FNR family transcriptional regulator, cyclic AMP receptor protein
MSTESKIKTLRGSDFFRDYPDDQLDRLLAITSEVEFGARQIIFHEHDPATKVYLIVSGSVSLVVCTPNVGCRQIMEVGDGDLIGWSPLLSRSRLSDTAKTLTPTKAIAIEGSRLLDLCKENPEFGFEFMLRTAKVLSERLHATRIRLLDVGGANLPNVAIESD